MTLRLALHHSMDKYERLCGDDSVNMEDLVEDLMETIVFSDGKLPTIRTDLKNMVKQDSRKRKIRERLRKRLEERRKKEAE